MSKDRPSNMPNSSQEELDNRSRLRALFEESPLGNDVIDAMQLYMRRGDVMRLLFFTELYRRIVDTHGVVMEFGCRWGKNLSLMTALRGIYEPYNHNRRIVGFDTFDGLRGTSAADGRSSMVKENAFSTAAGYESHLTEVLTALEAECPIPHIRKFEIVKGDVRETLPAYLERNPQTVVAFAYFDMDIYDPTKVALEAIRPHLTKGSIIGFDEMNWDAFPGPTLALKEVFGLGAYKIHHSPLQPIPGWIEIV
ncbi:MAG: class I SAM-dependent methyltransferase [Pseudolabrys sp.]|nr:class I SAM-dependent methyltransferase [Pseudolabrys sp.]